jgi:molybdenum cofactor biosynthesis enzyme
MCKSFSHGIVIGDVRLLAKDGGKHAYSMQGTP